jgi:hypothetical protein
VISQEKIMRLRQCAVVLIAVVSQAGSALGQTSPGMAPVYNGESSAEYERKQREYWRAQEAERMEQQRRQQMDDEQRRRDQEASKGNSRLDGGVPSPGGAPSYGGSQAVDMRAQGKEMLRLPPLPVERNVLLGSWRLEGGGQQGALLERGMNYKGTGGAGGGLGELLSLATQFDPGKAFCEVAFGRGITFEPSTYSSSGVAGVTGGPVAYRSRNKQVIVAIPGDSRANPMPFTIAGPNRIVYADSCALVRVGAPGANAATNTTTAPGTARTGAASPSPRPAGAPAQVAAVAPAPPPSTLARPSPEVCRNTLVDKIGVVGINQVRAMSDARYKEMPIEGKVPNSNNWRIDLRGSACDDPRIKATLYDFDANSMLQSVTYVWDRPPGPTPAPIFQERVASLARLYPSLPAPQSPGRLQGDTSLGRLILQDMPERNLLLEAYRK